MCYTIFLVVRPGAKLSPIDLYDVEILDEKVIINLNQLNNSAKGSKVNNIIFTVTY